MDELIEQVAEDLTTLKGYSETQAYKLIYSGGLKIYSTQNSKIQKICEKAHKCLYLHISTDNIQ